MLKKIKELIKNLTEPSSYDIWEEAFNRAKKEREEHGSSEKYWKIWYEEVCPAYEKLCNKTPKALQAPDTDKVLHDMKLKVSERKYY